MSLATGARLGSYEIVAKLGEGGMGEVYRARDTRLNRDVAIKVLPEAFGADPDRLARFTREAQTLAALNHPNIAHIHGVEESSAGQGLVMELVEGRDLSAVITRDGAIAAKESVAIVRQIAEALEAAHDAGVVHRDLKPANIKVRDDGTVKVLDFGLAKLSGPVESAGPGSLSGASATMTSPAMTGMGVILGTASYMSPEQAKGRAVDRRADIWAFGAVWYEMLTGLAPFPGETITDVIAAVVTRDPDWTKLPASTPPLVRTLLRRCLEKDPKQRLRDIGEVRLALAGDSGQAPVAQTSTGRLGWIVAGVLLAALAASIFWPRGIAQPTIGQVKYDVMPPGKSALKVDVRPAVAISPDGSSIVFSAIEGGVTKLYLRRRSEIDATVITGSDGGTNPAFSPDGTSIAFVTPTDLIRKSLDGAAVSIAKVNDPRGIAWLNDNEIILSPETATGLFIVPAAGGASKPLTTIDPKTDDRTHRWPAVVPGGKAVLFTVGTTSSPDNYDDSRVDAVIVATGERRKVMEGASFVHVTPDGYLVFAKAGALSVAPFDSERLVTTGPAMPLLQGAATDTTTGAVHFAFAGDGTFIYIPGYSSTIDRQLVWVDRKGTPTPLSIQPALYNDIRFSPSGDRIAVVIGTSGTGDISIYNTTSTALTRITFEGDSASPIWSRNGRSVYYASVKLRETKLLRRPADGSGTPEVLGSMSGRAYLEAIDQAEGTAYFSAYDARIAVTDIYSMPIGKGPAAAFVSGIGYQLASALSPDGRWLAYQSDEGVRPEIFVRDLVGGGRSQVSTTGGEEPHWSLKGDEIFYRNDTQFMSAAVATTPSFKSSPPTLLFDGIYNLRSETGISYDIDPKTGRFLMLRPAGQFAGAPAPRVRVITNWTEALKGRVK